MLSFLSHHLIFGKSAHSYAWPCTRTQQRASWELQPRALDSDPWTTPSRFIPFSLLLMGGALARITKEPFVSRVNVPPARRLNNGHGNENLRHHVRLPVFCECRLSLLQILMSARSGRTTAPNKATVATQLAVTNASVQKGTRAMASSAAWPYGHASPHPSTC